jgi:arylsulfatase
MNWPGRIKSGQISNKVASLIDILPTLSYITNSPLPEKKIDGINIYSLLNGEKNANPRKVFYYYFEDNELQAIRMNQWKLVFPHDYKSYEDIEHGKNGYPGDYNHKQTGLKLFNLRNDPGERYDVSNTYPEIVDEIMLIAQEARNDLGDSLTGESGLNRREPGRVN